MRRQSTVLVLLDKSRAAGRRLLRGIVKYSHLCGPWGIRSLPPFYRDPQSKIRMLSQAKDLQVDGIIATIDDKRMAKVLGLTGLPAVLEPAKNQIPGFPSIFDAADKVGQTCAEHLLSLGLSNFAFCGFENFCWSGARKRGFDKKILEVGFQTCSYKVPRSGAQVQWDNEQTALAEWLRSLSKPLGLMVCNDDCGHYVIEACHIAGLRVPDDVAIIGVDDDELICDLTNPPLSSAALNHEDAGYKAAKLLDKMMAGEKIDIETLISLEPSHIVVRQSTDVLVVNDNDLVKAVRFIRGHSGRAIQVRDVVEAVALSRRVLERRFREVFKKSVYDEIRRVRVERATRMLLETDLSVSQIATSLGFPTDKHISRYFRREKGMTPQQYREKFGRRQPHKIDPPIS
jgi:LacI family transcriptional regulator